MLVVKVELHPHGDSSRAHTIAEMHIANTGKSESLSVGNYKVFQVDKNGKRCKQGKVEGHPRLAVSVWKLVAKALNALGHGPDNKLRGN